MIRLEQLEQHPQTVAEGWARKYVPNAQEAVDKALALNEQRKQAIREVEDLRAELNRISKEIGNLIAQKRTEEAEAAKARTKAIKERIPTLEQLQADTERGLNDLLLTLPNLPHPSVPLGRTAEENPVVAESGRSVNLHAGALPHWELAAQHRLIDFELGAKIAGAGFPVYLGKGAKLQRALIAYFLDRATAAGYTEVQPPLVVNEASGYGTGQLPDKEGQMYHVTEDGLYLIPTAEVPVTNLYRDVVLEEADLPIRNCAYSACFRREAGSYGAHVRGLNRLHQFDKVEIVQIAHPDHSYDILEQMRTYVAGLLEELGLAWRTILLCTGDMSFASAKTYDMEVWSGAQGRWLEVSSVSNFEAFQASRMKCRFRPSVGGPTRLAHTLNGSALALPRIVACILENNQQPDGSIVMPSVLVPYLGFDRIG
jgi:seryl-tRNA synthetase